MERGRIILMKREVLCFRFEELVEPSHFIGFTILPVCQMIHTFHNIKKLHQQDTKHALLAIICQFTFYDAMIQFYYMNEVSEL